MAGSSAGTSLARQARSRAASPRRAAAKNSAAASSLIAPHPTKGEGPDQPGAFFLSGPAAPPVHALSPSAKGAKVTTMEAFLKYPELPTLDRLPEILSVRQVVATEKLHGSNFR